MAEFSLFGAFLLGLMGAGHCLGMCGGIISSLSMATNNSQPNETQQKQWLNISLYQLGRITSYTIFGLIAGLIGQQADELTAIPVLKILSGVLLILMGLYLSRVWMVISHLEKLGKLLWNKISPLSKKLLPVKTAKQALFLGALWGWLPCGLVYTSLGYALTAAQPINSALFMLAFGLGTLPATLLAGAASAGLKNWLSLPIVRFTTASLFIVFGLYTLYSLIQTGQMAHHHH
jgi:uncharacterized protein